MKPSEKAQTKNKKGAIAALSSTVLWIVAFVLLFVLPAGSKIIWVSDFLLLVGFFPLLWAYPAGWPWLIFGILNTIIGVMMYIGYYLPDLTADVEKLRLECSSFGMNIPTGVEVEKMRQMLQASHPAWVWVVVGLVCTIFGVFRMIKNTILLIAKLKKQAEAKKESGAQQ